ncbi:MAG: class I SAM-dependent methyltransferase [bacterium]|nr:class I SAM-dependent methyltransferase [bacterium]
MNEEFRSRWQRDTYTFDQFEANIENTRGQLQRPFTKAYRELFKKELGAGEILTLGIGTGQVETWTGIDPKRIVGIDATGALLEQAQKRLPGARLIHGTFSDVLPTLQETYSLAFASDSLDCIYPADIVKNLRLIRDKTDKLFISQVFLPDDEFYAFHYPSEEAGSRGGPGIEGWTSEQHQLVENRLLELGINHRLNQPVELLNDIQRMVEKNLGLNLRENFADLLKQMGVRFKESGIAEFKDSPLAVQISRFLFEYDYHLGRMRDRYAPKTTSPKEAADYVNFHTIHRFAQLLHSSIQMEYFLTILEDACKKAGFKTVSRSSIAASGNNIVSNQQIGQDINNALGYIRSSSIPIQHIMNKRKFKGSTAMLNGAGLAFIEPAVKPFEDVLLQCIVAK